MNQPTAFPTVSPTTALQYVLKGMRPKQWTKNAFVWAGIVFAEKHLLTNIPALLRVGIAFLLFCLISSAVYLINDLVDIEHDRQHPKKRLRPLAAGLLSPTLARVAAVVLIVGSLLIPIMLTFAGSQIDGGWGGFTLVLALYFVLQLAYTFILKHVVIIDLFAIAGGFVLRAVGGATVVSVAITPWWLLCVLLLALFLGLGKRRSELNVLEREAGSHRKVLKEYSLQLLDQLIVIDLAGIIMAYSEATFTAPAVPVKPFPFLMLTIPFVIYALFRYLYLIIQRNEGGEPADLLFRDRPFFVSIAFWGMLVIAILVIFRHQ